MINEVKRDLFVSYIKSNIAPILVDFIDVNSIPNNIVLSAKCKMEDLTGHYIETNYVPPMWLNKILTRQEPTILVIDRIDSIPKNEQTKFIEILKYRQVSTFKLPINTVIVVTANKIDEGTINEEIYSLVAHIKG